MLGKVVCEDSLLLLSVHLVGCAIDNGATKGDLVSVFQFVTYTDTTGQDAELHWVVLEAAGDVETGGVALHGGAQGKDDFFDVATGHTFYQAVNLEVLGAHAVHRTDKSA